MKHIKYFESIRTPKFNIGDKVVCVDDRPNTPGQKQGLKEGDEYEIIKINSSFSGNAYIIKNSDGKILSFPDGSGFGEHRFRTQLEYTANKYNI